jgi:hypothetical protein
MPVGGKIEVLTTLPNRYSSFSVEAPTEEADDFVTITRIELPAHKSGMVDQAKAFIFYARAVLRHMRNNEYDLVFATSSRLMTAVLGAWVARSKKIPLYLDIRDIFVDTIKDVLPRRFAVLAKPFFAALERWAVGGASRVNLVSRGFAAYFEPRYPGNDFSYFTNGIDDEFLGLPASENKATNEGLVQVLYAGNLGEGQGLHAIIPQLAVAMRGRANFKIIGDGGRKDALQMAIKQSGVDNVELLPPMKREFLIDAYTKADVLFLHLNNYEAFEKVLPSKLFEYGATGKPIWAGVSGYAAEFLRTEMSNAEVFNPCDAIDAERAFLMLNMRTENRAQFIAKFSRKNIANIMARDILDTAVRCADAQII